MRPYVLLLACCYALLSVEPVPGQTVRIPFPDLPTPLAGGTAELIVRLPTGYSAQRNWPVFLWLNGGTGPAGINTAYSSDVPFIHISMPLFKKPTTKGPGIEAVHLSQEDDDLIWSCFSTMLAEFDRLVPNQDRRYSLVGGYSNGAHCIGVLSSHHPEFVQRFQGYMLCDGGGYMFLGAKCILGRTLLVSAGEQSPIFARQQSFAEEAKAAGIATTWLPLPNQGHETPSKGKTLEEAIAWVRDQVACAGLKESLAALAQATQAKRWPAAITAFREVSGRVDERRPEWPAVLAGKEAIETACSEAIGKIPATANAKDLRTFVSAWQPAQALAPVRERADTLGRAELAAGTALTDAAARRKEMLRLLYDWNGYPVRTAVVAELDQLATADLVEAEAHKSATDRLKALRKVSETFSATPTAAKAEAAANAIGVEELPQVLAEKTDSARMRRLQGFVKTYRGLACAETAQKELDALDGKMALAATNRLISQPKSPERTRNLKAIIERYPGSEAAKLAQAELGKK